MIALGLLAAARAGSTDVPVTQEASVEPPKSDKPEVQLGLWIQPDVRFESLGQAPVPADEGEPADPRTTAEIGLRRARLTGKLKVGDGWSARIEVAGDDGQIGVADVYATYEPSDSVSISAGRLRGPAGLEQATSTKDLAFLDRGLVADLGAERSLAVEGEGVAGPLIVQLAVARGARDQLNDHDGTNVDLLSRVAVAPSDACSVGVHAAALTRHFGAPGYAFSTDLGDTITPRPYTGTAMNGGADVSVSTDPFRASVEAAMLFEGITDGTVSGHAVHAAVVATAGVGFPGAEHHDAVDGGGLKDGAELLARFQLGRSIPAPGDGDAGQLVIVSGGVGWVPTKNVRLEVEGGWEGLRPGARDGIAPSPASAITAAVWAGVGF